MRGLRTIAVLVVLLVGCEPPSDGGFSQGDDDDATEPPTALAAEIELGEPVACAAPGDGRFDDVAGPAGLGKAPVFADRYVPGERYEGGPPLGFSSTDIENQGALAVADLDGDGHLDIVLVEADSVPSAWRGDGALNFEPWDLDLPAGHYTGVSAVDVEGDGDLDLYFGRDDDNLFLRNIDGVFVDATEETGLGGGPLQTVTMSWADFDRDGDLDVYLANYGSGSMGPDQPSVPHPDLLLVQEDGRFAEDTAVFPQSSRTGFSYVGGWFDANEDGWLDLYVVTDLAIDSPEFLPNHLLLNDGGVLEPAPDSGLDHRLFSMGLALGDLDSDGDEDVHVSNAGPTLLVRNDDGLFVDISLTVGVLSNRPEGDISWATDFVDLDNDGRNELFTAFGYMPTKGPGGGPAGTHNAEEQHDTVWRWDASSQSYDDVAPTLGLDNPAWTRTAVPADFDRDGSPELLTWGLDGGLALQTAGCNDRAWLRIGLRGPEGNRFAIGAKVTAYVDGLEVTRRMNAGSTGSMSSQPPELLLGLGSADEVVLDVIWPDGSITRNEGVPTRREVLLTQP